MILVICDWGAQPRERFCPAGIPQATVVYCCMWHYHVQALLLVYKASHLGRRKFCHTCELLVKWFHWRPYPCGTWQCYWTVMEWQIGGEGPTSWHGTIRCYKTPNKTLSQYDRPTDRTGFLHRLHLMKTIKCILTASHAFCNMKLFFGLPDTRWSFWQVVLLN